VGATVNEILQLFQSPAWWFSDVVLPLLLPALLAVTWRWVFPAVSRINWVDTLLTCHCVIAIGLAIYLAGWTPFLELEKTTWQHGNVRLSVIAFLGYLPMSPFMGPVNPEWPKKAIALTYSCIAILFIIAAIVTPQPLWLWMSGYCFVLGMAGFLYSVVSPFIEKRYAISTSDQAQLR
jgi:hypothetical protein